jgi:hypothetical protein
MPSAWGWFTGADKAKKEAMATAGQNKTYIGEGLKNQLGYYSDAKNEAQGQLNPYAQQGGRANTAYGSLLGLNGSGAQADARQAYQGFNPYLQGDMDASARSIARRGVASGSYNSGLNALAQNRAGMEIGSRDFGAYNDRLAGQAQMGYGAATGLAGNAWNYAQNAGNAQQGATQGYVGNNTNLGNALSAANISPMSGATQAARLAISAYTGMPPAPAQSPGNNYAAGGSNQLQSSNYNNGYGYFGGGR